MAVRSLPVVAETPLHPRPRTRGKTPKHPATPPQNHQPRVVSDQVQPLQRFLAAPAHPTVPQRTAEGARLPARSAHPPPAPREYVVQTATRKLLETPIVMTVHHTVPATHLIRPHKAHHPIPERKTLRGRLENIRCAFHGHHGYHAASPTASTNPNHPEPAEPSLPTNLVVHQRCIDGCRMGRYFRVGSCRPRVGLCRHPLEPGCSLRFSHRF